MSLTPCMRAATGWRQYLTSMPRALILSLYNRFQALHLYGKLFVIALLCFYTALTLTIIIITPAQIFQFMHDQAAKLAELGWTGWFILAGAIVVLSFPPMMGYSTAITLCGFTFPFMKAFILASVASILGSALVFVTLRGLFGTRLRKWSSQNSKWQALDSVIQHKGLPLIILIRMSPIPPWVYSNALFASVPSVSLWQFILASIFSLFRVLLQVFMGSRTNILSDGKTREQMDKTAKIVNAFFVVGGAIIGLVTSTIVYKSVQQHIRAMDDFPLEIEELSGEDIEDLQEDEAPLLRSLSPSTTRSP